jgi:hypothetical protein
MTASFAPSESSRAVLFRLGVALATLLAIPGTVDAQNPFPPEFRVNTYTTGTQRFRSVTGIPGHVFVVTWDSDLGGTTGIYAQRYSMIVPVELQSFTVE